MDFVNFLLFLNSRTCLAAIESGHQPRRCLVYFLCKGSPSDWVPLSCLEWDLSFFLGKWGLRVSDKTLACYKRDIKHRTNKQTNKSKI